VSNEPQRSRAAVGKDEDRPPDVLLEVPDIHIGKIEFNLDDLEASVRLNAQVLDLVHLQVGADVRLGHVGLLIEDIGVEAYLRVRLDAVVDIVAELMGLLKEQPQILTELTKGIGQGVEKVGEGVGEGVESIGEGVGSGADQALGGVGKGVEGLGEGAGEGVRDLGKGAGEGVKGAGEGVGKGVEKTGEGVGKGAEGLTNQTTKEDDDDGSNGPSEGQGATDRRGSERSRERGDRHREGNGERHHYEGHGGYERR
jgi:hypothetical protein